ncbi:MAG: IS1595 family transposase [Saprospiraceae bacterium]|nr:IS1595 family transposase [Saprospiraceae bacterium]
MLEPTGKVRSIHMSTINAESTMKVMKKHLHRHSTIYTDEAAYHRHIPRYFHKHETVNHSIRQYVRDGITTNTVEGFFGTIKRTFRGSYHYISPKYLYRYCAESDFRWNTRKLDDRMRMEKIVVQTPGRQMQYLRKFGLRPTMERLW